jgi:hypothetical protein
MDNVSFMEIESPNGMQIHAIIDNGDGSFTSMPKAVWDELEAAKENPDAQ